jgi:hypothetical protein
MEETNSPSVAHVGYDISPLSRVKSKILTTSRQGVEKYRNPRATEGESMNHTLWNIVSSERYIHHMQVLLVKHHYCTCS